MEFVHSVPVQLNDIVIERYFCFAPLEMLLSLLATQARAVYHTLLNQIQHARMLDKIDKTCEFLVKVVIHAHYETIQGTGRLQFSRNVG